MQLTGHIEYSMKVLLKTQQKGLVHIFPTPPSSSPVLTLPHMALCGVLCLLHLGIFEYKTVFLMTISSSLCILPHLIRTNPGYILILIIWVSYSAQYCTALSEYTKITKFKPFKRVNFMMCELYLSKKS